VPDIPFARSVLNPKYASARIFIGLPSSPKRCGASAGKAAASARHVSASRGDSAPIRAAVSSRSVETPHQVPSGKLEENGRAAGHRSPFEHRDPLPARGQMQRRRQRVHACAHQHRIIAIRHPILRSSPRGYLQTHLILSSMIPARAA
jgi:hypothetical protein